MFPSSHHARFFFENMKRQFLLISLATVVLFSGCKRIQALLHKKSEEQPKAVQAATPTPTPTPVAVATPTPAPAINKSASVIVLCYHRFEEKVRDSLCIAPVEFERQMQALKDGGFTVIPMKDFLAWRRGESDIPAKSAIITIDDGYVSGYDTAWPILKKFGYPFTMFVYVKYVNSGGKSVTWDQLAEMRDAGVDIECHSYSHEDLHGKRVKKETAEEIKKIGKTEWLRKEIVESKQIIEKQLGIKVDVFSYPFGVYNQEARDMVKEAGYEAAFTVYGQRLTHGSPYDLLGRYAIESSKPQILQAALNMVGGGLPSTSYTTQAPSVAEVSSAETEPKQGQTISDAKPLIKASVATMGQIDPATIEMRISGFGVVPAKYDAASGVVSYQVSQKLRDKSYTVILTAKVQGKKVETRWSFNFDPGSASNSTDASTHAVVQ